MSSATMCVSEMHGISLAANRYFHRNTQDREMASQSLTMASELITSIMEGLREAQQDKPLANASYGFFSAQGIEGRVLQEEFTLILSDGLSAILNVISNMAVLFEHPAALVCLQAEPSTAILRLLGIVAGIDVSELKVSAAEWPSVNEAASDIWRAPLYLSHPETMDLKTLDRLAARLTSRGVNDLYIDAPALLRLSARRPSAEADFPQICRELCSLARTYHMTVVGAHPLNVRLSEAAQIADMAIGVQDFAGSARFGFIRRGASKPTYFLAKREACDRYQDVMKVPWVDTERRFAAARRGS